MEKQEIDRYYAIANSIRAHVREAPKIVPDKDDWETAIVSANDLISLQMWDTSLKADFRDYAIANAVKTLRSYGYDVQLKEFQPLVANADRELLVTRMHDLARQIGGVNIARQMFNCLKPVYDHEQRRYHIVRRPNSWGGNTEPAVPWGYLYQLAGKYPLSTTTFNNFASLWNELVRLATNFSALYDVQAYNHFELMFQSPDTIINFLRELALYDHMFSLQQLRSTDVIKILRGLLKDLDWQLERSPGWTISEAFEVGSAILQLSRDKCGPVRVSANQLRHLCPSLNSSGRLKHILREIFSHPSSGANADYRLPTDIPGPDLAFKPLLPSGTEEYWLLDSAPCSYGVFEAIYSAARDSVGKKFDESLGHILESFLCQELTAKSVTWKTGNYEAGPDGECDIVVETKACVILIEVKRSHSHALPDLEMM